MNFLKHLNLKLLVVFCAVVLVIAGAGVVSAQTSSSPSAETAAKYNVTFPISELDNCASPSECREYCEDPLHRDACVEFAKKKGFYKEPSTKNADILAKAQDELGCSSPESCKLLCEQEENFEVCKAFAKKYNLGPPPKESSDNQTLAKARDELGCDSPESCKTFCEQEENEQKCSEFAKKNNLKGGENKKGPGGCTTEESCKTFCSDPENFEICSNFQITQGDSTFKGPGGCDSPESCKLYCEENPSECPNIKDDAGSPEQKSLNKEELCKKTPQCTWESEKCSCKSFVGMSQGNGDEMKTFCTENTDKCENGTPKVNPEEYCQRYPDRCKGGIDPKTRCSKNPQCEWSEDQNVCKCGQSENRGPASSKSAEFDYGRPLRPSISPVFNKEEQKRMNVTPSIGIVKPSFPPPGDISPRTSPPPKSSQQFMRPSGQPVTSGNSGPSGNRGSGSISDNSGSSGEQKMTEQKPPEFKPEQNTGEKKEEIKPSPGEAQANETQAKVQGASDVATDRRIPLVHFLRLLFR